MLIVMKPGAAPNEIERVLEIIEKLGYRGHTLPGEGRTAIGITGNKGSVDPAHFENLPGVADAIRVTKPYKLISKDLRIYRRRLIGDHRRTLCGRKHETGFRRRRSRRR